MNNTRAHSAAGWLRLSLLCLLLATAPASAVLDLNSDGIGDIYALKYNAAGLATTGDADQDGKTNLEEMIAGTDPWKGDSELAVSAVTIDASGVNISWLGVAGKSYVVQSATDLVLANWQDEQPAPIPGAGATIVRTFPLGATVKYYRVVAQDKDTDQDGVTDWEEITAGFNPNSAQSSGGGAMNDLAAITAALEATTNVATIVASDAGAVEPASGVAFDTGTFVITRSGSFLPVTINYSVSGTAAAGSDYLTLSGSVTLPMFANSASITVTPVADSALESPESVEGHGQSRAPDTPRARRLRPRC